MESFYWVFLRRNQSLHFWCNLNNPLPPEDDLNRIKQLLLQKKLQPLGYPILSKSRLYLLSHFREKYDYFLHYLGYFWQQKDGVTIEKFRINIWHILFHLNNFLKKLLFSTFQFCGYRSFQKNKGHFRKFLTGFSSSAAFLDIMPTYLKKIS